MSVPGHACRCIGATSCRRRLRAAAKMPPESDSETEVGERREDKACMCMYVCVYIMYMYHPCMHASIHPSIHPSVHPCKFVFLCMDACIDACIYVHTCIYLYTPTHTHAQVSMSFCNIYCKVCTTRFASSGFAIRSPDDHVSAQGELQKP